MVVKVSRLYGQIESCERAAARCFGKITRSNEFTRTACRWHTKADRYEDSVDRYKARLELSIAPWRAEQKALIRRRHRELEAAAGEPIKVIPLCFGAWTGLLEVPKNFDDELPDGEMAPFYESDI